MKLQFLDVHAAMKYQVLSSVLNVESSKFWSCDWLAEYCSSIMSVVHVQTLHNDK